MHSSSFLFIRDDGGGVDYLPLICLVFKCSGVPCLMTSKKETAIVLLLDSLEIIDLFFGRAPLSSLFVATENQGVGFVAVGANQTYRLKLHL